MVVKFYFDKDTKISVKKLVESYCGEIAEVELRDEVNVYTVHGLTDDSVFFLNNKFRLLDQRYDDYKEYGGFTDITEEYGKN